MYGRRSRFTTLKWPVNHFSTHETRQTAFHLLPKTPRDLPARNATASEPSLLTLSASKYYFIPCTAAQPAQEPTGTRPRDKGSGAGRAGAAGGSPRLTNVTFAAPQLRADDLAPLCPPASADALNGPGAPRAKGRTGDECGTPKVSAPKRAGSNNPGPPGSRGVFICLLARKPS